MGVFKVDLIFQAEGRGWTESYYKDYGSLTITGVYQEVIDLADLRISMSASPTFIKAFRVTDPLTEGVQGQVTYFNPRKEAPVIVTTKGAATFESGAASPDAAIVTAWYNPTHGGERRMWIRGVWDQAITFFNQLNDEAYGKWKKAFDAWRAFLVKKNYGWLTSNRAEEMQVSYTYDPDKEYPTFTFPGDFFDPLQVNTFTKVRFSKFNNSKSVLNRELVVFVTSTTQCNAAQAIAAGAMFSPGKGIRYDAPTFLPATDITVQRVGRRAPGAPLLVTPGRSAARART